MRRWRGGLLLAAIGLCSAALLLAWPQARNAAVLWDAQDDPAALSDAQIDQTIARDRGLIAGNIEEALAAGDADLANSLTELATAKNVALPVGLDERVRDAVAEETSPAHYVSRFANGLVTGNADDAGSLAGTMAGDLFVFGDIRDVTRESLRLARGEEADRVVLGLATAGIAITAAAYLSAGVAAPARAGLTLVKDASKVGRLGEGLGKWAGRSAREIVDAPALTRAVSSGSLARPGESVAAVRAAFRPEMAGGLLRVAKDVGRIGEKIGTKGALDTLRIAQGPKDIARAARLAEKKAGQSRGILKILGRGALVLSLAAFHLTSWTLWALLALVGFVCSIKRMTERTTQSWLDRRRARQRVEALTPASSMPLAAVPAHG